jgi:hypothetical protein
MYIRIPWKAQHERRIYNEKAQCSASRGISLASDLLIPMIGPKFPHFGSKIVEYSRYLPNCARDEAGTLGLFGGYAAGWWAALLGSGAQAAAS